MTPPSHAPAAVFVEAAARLHLGVLDLRGSLGRWFGGLGVSAPAPTLLLEASAAPTLDVTGEDASRAQAFARRFLDYHQVSGGARLHVHRALPSHAGLGSGTQLGLAVGGALAELHHIEADAPALARAVGRARRSAIGTWTFAGGGLVVEGGRHRERDGCGPLLVRLMLPSSWRCVVAVPDVAAAISGDAEERAFADLPPPAQRDVERVAHLVLMALLPAAAEGDLPAFGAALSAFQAATGAWWAPAQGGVFAPGASDSLLRALSEWGAVGVGQSSWGPAVYGIVEGEDRGEALAARVRQRLGSGGAVYNGAFRTTGARIWRGAASDALQTAGQRSNTEHE